MKPKKPSKKTGSMSSKHRYEDAKYWENRPINDKRKDWRNGAGSWIDEYVQSVDHPHRDCIIHALKSLEPFESVFEIGCNAGPNLLKIREEYGFKVDLFGCDVNEDAIERADLQNEMFMVEVEPGDNLAIDDKNIDIMLCDAVLMYADPKSMRKIAKEIDRVTKKGIILVEWWSSKDELKDHHWARYYPDYFPNFYLEKWLTMRGIWNSKNWEENGSISVFRRR